MMEKKHLDVLKRIVGEENVYDDKAHLIAYSYDATREHFEPDAVIFPRDEQDVSTVLRYCNDHRIVIVPRGAGSGFTGGALPSSGGIVLAFEKHMNKILEIDMQNMVAVVQPGVVNMDLQRAVEEVGLFYPPDPASQKRRRYACGEIRYHQGLRYGDPRGTPKRRCYQSGQTHDQGRRRV